MALSAKEFASAFSGSPITLAERWYASMTGLGPRGGEMAAFLWRSFSGNCGDDKIYEFPLAPLAQTPGPC
jgi:hypothetical protein